MDELTANLQPSNVSTMEDTNDKAEEINKLLKKTTTSDSKCFEKSSDENESCDENELDLDFETASESDKKDLLNLQEKIDQSIPSKRSINSLNLKKGETLSKVLEAFNSIRSDKNENYEKPEKTDSTSVLRLTTESLLVLDLLTMNYEEREQFLLKRAVENQLLIKNKSTEELVVSPELIKSKSKLTPNLNKFIRKFSINKQGKSMPEIDKKNRNSCSICNISTNNCCVQKILQNFKGDDQKEKKSQNKETENHCSPKFLTKIFVNRSEETEQAIDLLYSNKYTHLTKNTRSGSLENVSKGKDIKKNENGCSSQNYNEQQNGTKKKRKRGDKKRGNKEKSDVIDMTSEMLDGAIGYLNESIKEDEIVNISLKDSYRLHTLLNEDTSNKSKINSLCLSDNKIEENSNEETTKPIVPKTLENMYEWYDSLLEFERPKLDSKPNQITDNWAFVQCSKDGEIIESLPKVDKRLNITKKCMKMNHESSLKEDGQTTRMKNNRRKSSTHSTNSGKSVKIETADDIGIIVDNTNSAVVDFFKNFEKNVKSNSKNKTKSKNKNEIKNELPLDLTKTSNDIKSKNETVSERSNNCSSNNSNKNILNNVPNQIQKEKEVLLNSSNENENKYVPSEENEIIAKLLMLNRTEQDKYLITLAEKYKILIKEHTQKCNLNAQLNHNVWNSNILKFIDSHFEKAPPSPPFVNDVSTLITQHGGNIGNCPPILNVIDDAENMKQLDTLVEYLVKNNFGSVVEGPIRINEGDIYKAYLKNSDGPDVRFDTTTVRQCSMQDDIVRAFVFDKSLWKLESQFPNPKGFVIKILKEVCPRMVVGHLQKSMWLVPRTKRFPDVKIPKETLKKNFQLNEHMVYAAKIVKVTAEGRYIGKIVEEIGSLKKISNLNKIILRQHDLHPNQYDEKILRTLPDESYKIPNVEYEQRDVLTKQCVFTIDPETAKDLDDALSCRILSNGNYEIGVHISDVTYFLKENSELDKLVQKQTTSIYMVDQVYHMLPKTLCMLCSLLPGQDKLSFSVFWEISSDGIIQNTRFVKTIINSCVQLAYCHAQKIIDNTITDEDLPKIYNGFSSEIIKESVNNLHLLAQKIRQARFEKGALRFNQPKLSFELDQTSGEPKSWQVYELADSNFLIEEFMLLANQSVAKFCYTHYPDIAILRNHSPPDSKQINELKQRLGELNFELDATDSKTLSISYNSILQKCENKSSAESVLNKMLAKPMVRAEYFCSAVAENDDYLRHFALAMPIYTHFTSPIRRYPDVLVHRVLSAALNLEYPPSRTVDELQQLTTVCNTQKYNAKLAGDDCSQVYFIRYIKSVKSIQLVAAVYDIFEYSVQVVLIETGHKINIHMRDQEGLSVKPLDEPGYAQLFFENKKDEPLKITLFSELNVEVYVSQGNTLKAKILPWFTVEKENELDEKVKENDKENEIEKINENEKVEENNEIQENDEINKNNQVNEKEDENKEKN